MRTTTVLAAVLLLAGAAVGCTSSKPAPGPTATVTKTASAAPTVDAIAACTDAIAAGKDKGDGAAECADLSPDDYLEALQTANRRARASFDACTDDPASCTDEP
jgi:hypothetical protein